MKNLIFLFIAAMLTVSASAQTLTLNCDSTFTISIPPTSGVTHYQIYLAEGGTAVLNTNIVAVVGGTTVYNSTFSISPSLSQYSLTIGKLISITPPNSNTYPFPQINLIWTVQNADGSVSGVPAKLGYAYTANAAPLQVTSCAIQSAAAFVVVKKKKRGH